MFKKFANEYVEDEHKDYACEDKGELLDLHLVVIIIPKS